VNITRISFLALTALALVSVAAATQRLVPFPYQHIQDAINDAQNGDTISVWGPPPGQNAPPYIYHENIVFRPNISLTVANRSFLGATPCPPSWDRVVKTACRTAQLPRSPGGREWRLQ